MKLYYKFRNSSLDTSPLGLISGGDQSNSVYTPEGSRIVAWLNSGDVHFCQTEGYGDMVFMVSPDASPGDCIRPVAESLKDFIGLLIACPNAELIASAYQWSRIRFTESLKQIRPTMKMRSVMRALQNTYLPPVISDPYGYMAALAESFDYSSIPLNPSYFEWCPIRPGTPKWDVGMDTAFADYCEQGKRGQELAIKKSFQWQNQNWVVPAIYLCENGIVVDSYKEVPLHEIEQFRSKWINERLAKLSQEERMCMQLDDPLILDANGILDVNGKNAPRRKLFTMTWNPKTENSWNARRTLEHYGLDREKGYLFRRESFLRKGKNPPIRTMDLTLQAEPVAVPGQRFVAPDIGETMTFTHPVTNETHELTVIAQVREALDPNFLSNDPCCYTRLMFSVVPHISRDWFQVVDCDPGDLTKGLSYAPNVQGFASNLPVSGHCAASSLRYTPASSITWRMVFRRKVRQDITIALLP